MPAYVQEGGDVMEMRRRGFLIGAAAGACVAVGGEAEDAQERVPPAVIAPPGADGGERLRRRCTACNLCVAKCPTKVLRAATLEYGLAGTMMPVMDFSRGYCEKECTLCGEVCPTGAIRRLTKEEKSKTQIGRAELVEGWKDRCLAFKDGFRCSLCATHCRYEAVKVVEEEFEEKTGEGKSSKRKVRLPKVDPVKCVGCGACAHVCPAHVLGIQPPR